MESVLILTTIDITPTGVRNKSDDLDWMLKRNQQRNYDTLIQCISLRGQPLNPIVRDFFIDPRFNDWGLYVDDTFELIKIWQMQFEVDRVGLFGINGELLLKDVDSVPIVPGLTETVPSFPPTFISYNKFKNIRVWLAE